MMLKRLTLAGLAAVVLAAGMIVAPGGGGPARPEPVSAEASFPLLLSPQLCAALLAVRAHGAAVLHDFFSCKYPEGQGGDATHLMSYRGHPVDNIDIIAAASLADGQNQEFPNLEGFVPPYECADPSFTDHALADDIPELLCELDGRDGAFDSQFHLRPEDFKGIDLGGGRIEDTGGSLFAVTFVNTHGLVQFDSNVASFNHNASPEWICTGATDKDCEPGSTAGDGVVVAVFGPKIGETLPRGKQWLEVTQANITYPKNFIVTGIAYDISLSTFESSVQTGLDQATCPLPGAAAGFVSALGLPTKSVLVARVIDSDGTPVTGSFVSWVTSDKHKAIWATGLTPTLDLGSFGFGAPNIICGADNAGAVTLTANLLDQTGQAAVLPGGIAFNFYDRAAIAKKDFTVVGAPASITLIATPASLVCDGKAGVEVAATVTDANGTPVVAGDPVGFDVQVLGSANPPIAKTGGDGVAKSTITPFALGTAQGVPVTVFAGDAINSILISCQAGQPEGAGAAPAGGGGAGGAGGGPAGTIAPPNTGSGAAAGAGRLSWWPAVALLAGAVVLAGVRYVRKEN